MFSFLFRPFSPIGVVVFIMFLVSGGHFLVSCGPSGPRTVEQPWINLSNTATIDIDKVELTDSATILTVKATFRPHWWIKIAPETHLIADGKDYAMTATEGIDPGKEFWMPDSGKAEFRLFFEPLPFNTKSFDFIEGDEPGAFRLLDIDLTGRKVAEYPEGVPGDFKRKVKDTTMPEPVFEMGKTTIAFHIRPYRPEIASGFNLYVNSMGAGQQEYPLAFDDKGNAMVSFEQYGSAHAFVVNTSSGVMYSDLTLYPGETVECYLDARISGGDAMRNNRDLPVDLYKRSIHNGKYSDYDRAVSGPLDKGNYRLPIYSSDFADYHMTGEQYKEMVKQRYSALSDSVNNSDMLGIQKEYLLLTLQNEVLEAMSDYRRILSRNYYNKYNNWRERVPEDSIPAKLTDADFKEVVTWFDVSNPHLLMIGSAMGDIDWNSYGVPGDLSKSIGLFREMSWKAKEQKLTEADLDSLRTLSNPFFAAACDSLAQRTRRECMELQKNVTVTPTPDVADDKVFDAIIAPHKGKVVVVDLWNTWCGPCRNALKQNEPLKTGELSDEDIVWIYIADDTSDGLKYFQMVPDIKGIHYKINEEQKKAVYDRFNVDGIPYYILVGRDGKAEGRPDLRDHNAFKEAVKGAL